MVFGSHNVIFGVVEAVSFGQTAQALVYHDRGYNFRIAYSPLRAGYGMVQLAGNWQMESESDSHVPLPPQTSAEGTPSHWTKA